ncbi:hypothetical protein GUITHDRAFT_110295 [Guillardia theta CCMP2712]|uniref:Amino acid transporter transmembrane domain-containing protein n=1 Tax=Guillardia theta (strain CCMP2712) TaxID=905079 RepID=L1J5N7_GUITC|nr:hypothetical protein GUITHDRAFT_110295 [Guillardia theta CCMP2712]EKX43843.1 hypothetical protein GUITHDRAFT_110295 [Guillardia theta CCMP2712]|eukprot:XP_005830823.1 hypothetical protein GUITHDRAFT_110295 [Guillardia theta CCMP2712]
MDNHLLHPDNHEIHDEPQSTTKTLSTIAENAGENGGHHATRLKFYHKLQHMSLLPFLPHPHHRVPPHHHLAVTPLHDILNNGEPYVWVSEAMDLGEESLLESNDQTEHEEKKQRMKRIGIARVFTIVNVMLGSSLLVVPWAYSRSGLLPGAALVCGIGGFCRYTSSLILRWSEGHEDFSEMCKSYLGKPAWHVCLSSSLVVLVGALLAYHTIMSDFLYSLSKALIPNSEYQGNLFYAVVRALFLDRRLSPLPIAMFVFPFANFRDVSTLARFTSYGIVAVVFTFCYILVTSWGAFIAAVEGGQGNVTFTLEQDSANPDNTLIVPLAGRNWGDLAGILPVSFFVHNLIIPIMRGDEPMKWKMMQHDAAFSLVVLIYSLVGASPVFSFAAAMQTCGGLRNETSCHDMVGCVWQDSHITGAEFSRRQGLEIFGSVCVEQPMSQNFLRTQLPPWPNPLASKLLHTLVQSAVLIQLLTIFPLVCAIVRGQFFVYVSGVEYPGRVQGLVFVVFIIGLSTLILGIVGAISGTLYVCVLPISLHLVALNNTGNLSITSFIIHVILILGGTFLFVQGVI